MTILSFRAGAASEMIATPPRRADFGPNQLSHCRRKIRGFADMERVALRIKRELERSREQINQEK